MKKFIVCTGSILNTISSYDLLLEYEHAYKIHDI